MQRCWAKFQNTWELCSNICMDRLPQPKTQQWLNRQIDRSDLSRNWETIWKSRWDIRTKSCARCALILFSPQVSQILKLEISQEEIRSSRRVWWIVRSKELDGEDWAWQTMKITILPFLPKDLRNHLLLSPAKVCKNCVSTSLKSRRNPNWKPPLKKLKISDLKQDSRLGASVRKLNRRSSE